MIVLLDIGNTRSKYCFCKTGLLVPIQAIENDLLTSEFLTKHFASCKKLVLASVSKSSYVNLISDWCKLNDIGFHCITSEREKNGVRNAYEKPSSLGVDRWLVLLGAKVNFPNQNLLIIDAGTATTFDLLTANGQHKGGWILAGMNMLVSSVVENTAKLSVEQQAQASFAFGHNTSDNIYNAAWAATIGAVNLAISQSEQQGVFIDKVVLTGGNAHALASLLSVETTVIEDLVFKGLQAYA